MIHRCLAIMAACALSYMIPFLIGSYLRDYWGVEIALPLLMFWGGMVYKAYIQKNIKDSVKQ